MRFSVIIPVYNVEDYLAECLDSVMHQSFRDFEVILIDDGSTDKSGEICDAYAQRYPEQIKLLHQENQGVVKTRITGLNHVSGEICVFVDSDDVLRQDALEVLQKAFAKNDCDLVLYNLSRDPLFSIPRYNIPLEEGKCLEGEGKKELYTLLATFGKLDSMCTKAAKKEVYDRFLKEYVARENLTYGEDLYLSMPLVTDAKKILWLGEVLYYYRDRAGSLANSFDPCLHRSMKTVWEEMGKYISLWEIPECYPAFYAKVVYNWIHALKELLKNQDAMTKAERAAILQEMSGDEFFRKAYKAMQPDSLCRRDSLLARWLYQGKFLRLRLIGRGFTLLKKS